MCRRDRLDDVTEHRLVWLSRVDLIGTGFHEREDHLRVLDLARVHGTIAYLLRRTVEYQYVWCDRRDHPLESGEIVGRHRLVPSVQRADHEHVGLRRHDGRGWCVSYEDEAEHSREYQPDKPPRSCAFQP